MNMTQRVALILAFNMLVLSVFTLTVGAQDDLNCDDFISQDASQTALDADPADPNKLDRDNDGLACSSFPYQELNTGDGVLVVTLDDASIDAIVDGVLAGILAAEADEDVPPGVDDADSGPTPVVTDDGYSVLAIGAMAEFLESLED